MKRNQMQHALWMLLTTILLNVHNVHASATFCNIISKTDTMNDIVSKSSSTNTLNVIDIPGDEQEKIQKITTDLAQRKFTSNIDEKAIYIYKELGKAAHNKHLHVLDHLLSLNFEQLNPPDNGYMLFNLNFARIAGIPAAQGDEDLAIITKILNAKQAAFLRFGKINERQHKIEMTEIANRIIAFSVIHNPCDFVRNILENPALICFDVDGVNWALRNIMKTPNSTKRSQLIHLLYENTHVKPDLQGTIDALEIALDSNNGEALSTILRLDITHNHHIISDILKESMLNVRARIVHKLINCMKAIKKSHDFLTIDENSKILTRIKFDTYSDNIDILKEYPVNSIKTACCEFIETVYDLHTKTNKTDSISEYFRYISNRDRFKENMFPIFTLKIHKENDLKLHPEVYQQLTELWNYLLIKSSAFGDFQMGMDLLSEKYSIDFDKPTIQSAIDSINTCLQGYELPPTKKIKKEHETPSESDVFLNLLKSKRH